MVEVKSIVMARPIDGSDSRVNYHSRVYLCRRKRRMNPHGFHRRLSFKPPSHSLLTSLPKRDDLIQSTQTSSRFLQLKHMFT